MTPTKSQYSGKYHQRVTFKITWDHSKCEFWRPLQGRVSDSYFYRASEYRKEPSGRTKPVKGDGKDKEQNKTSMQGPREAQGKQHRSSALTRSQQEELGCQLGGGRIPGGTCMGSDRSALLRSKTLCSSPHEVWTGGSWEHRDFPGAHQCRDNQIWLVSTL